LHDPGTDAQDGLIRLDELGVPAEQLATVQQLRDSASNSDVTLEGTFGLAVFGPDDSTPFTLASTDLKLTWTDWTNLGSLKLGPADGSASNPFLDLVNKAATGQFLGGLSNVATQIQALTNTGVLGAKIPLINQSLADLLGSSPQPLDFRSDGTNPGG